MDKLRKQRLFYPNSSLAKTYPKGRDLDDAFRDRFGRELSTLDAQNHRIIIGAPELDDSAERIISYLAKKYGVDINAVFFSYRKLSGGEDVLLQSVWVLQYVAAARTRRKPTEAELMTMAKENNTRDLVEVCRQVRSFP